jgi:hypothetical protein
MSPDLTDSTSQEAPGQAIGGGAATSVSPWERLIARYATPEMRVCNCRKAYAMQRNFATLGALEREFWTCAHGCSAAQIAARDIVARLVLQDLARGEAAVDAESRLRFPDTTGS